MNATMITCPNCGTEIPLSEALKEQFRHENEARLAVLAGQAQQKARADFAVEKNSSKASSPKSGASARRRSGRSSQCARKGSAVEDRARELDLEVARSVDGEKQGLAEQQDLKLKEKDKVIDDLRKSLDDAKRKSERGSRERQGEVLEVDVQAELERHVPTGISTLAAAHPKGAPSPGGPGPIDSRARDSAHGGPDSRRWQLNCDHLRPAKCAQLGGHRRAKTAAWGRD